MDTWSMWVNFSQHAAPMMLDAAARSLVVLALAGIAVVAMRRASAASRHLVWLLALAGLLALPAMALILPGWRVLPPSWRENTSPQTLIIIPPSANDLSDASATAAGNRALPAPTGDPASDAPVARSESSPLPAVSSAAAVPESAAVVAVSDADKPAQIAASAKIDAPAPVAHRTTASSLALLPWQFWLSAAWSLGALLVLAHVTLGFLSLWLLRRQCRPLTADGWSDLLKELSAELGLRQRVELLSSPRRAMPMTWGIFRTYILLPEQASAWPAEQRRAVLLHELAHAKRRDCLTQLLGQAACAAYWINPLVWVAWRRMQVERERACDDLALLAGARASTYAQHLLQTASALPAPRFVGAAAAMARPSTLEERLRAILDPNRQRTGMSRRTGAAAAALLLAALAPIAALRAQAPVAPAPALPPAAPVPPAATDASSIPPSETIQGRMATRRAEQLGAEGTGIAAPASAAGTATCALDATIYDVRIPLDKLGQVDAEALDKAAGNAATFEKALADIGTATPLYRATQSVRLAGDTISINTQMPYITNSQITAEGKTINSVGYRDTGATFALAGKADGADTMRLSLTVNVTALSDSGTLISSNVTAPIFRDDTLVHKGVVKAKRPFLLISVDAASRDQAGKAVAYIARVTVGAPQVANLLDQKLREERPQEHAAIEGLPILRIDVAGNKDVPESVIADKISTRVGDPNARGKTDRDVKSISALELFAIVRADVEPVGAGVSSALKGVNVHYVVEERRLITGIEMIGNTLFTAAQLREGLTSRQDKAIVPFHVATDTRWIIDQYQSKGYAKATVNVDQKLLEDKGILRFQIDEGPTGSTATAVQ